jgi:hypothetical protein
VRIGSTNKFGHYTPGMKEEVEQIDELKKSTLVNYIRKGAVSLRKPNIEIARGKNVDKNIDKVNKREMGMHLAAKKLAKEEAEQVSEVLKPSMGAGAYISDFVHSKNPKFDGKSKAMRTKMALGAYYGDKKGMKEAKLDPVGSEDSDVNNDGKHGHSTDKYLMNRRKKISQAMKMKEETRLPPKFYAKVVAKLNKNKKGVK